MEDVILGAHGRGGVVFTDSRSTELAGCCELRPRVYDDSRGRLVKVFHRDAFAALGFATDFVETYYSMSHRGVIRGLHFQTPPAEHAKLVCCTSGRVQDAVVDLRRGSPTYGMYVTLELSAEIGNMLYIPPGMAHGFCVLSRQAHMVYQVTSQYDAGHDAGIRWDSARIPWKIAAPILSERDRNHPALSDFSSPFLYHPGGRRQ
ncbi:MAG: dTDP-4-dehydrorhamnose 3,5-epimerase [Polyangia bacterium]